MIKLSRDIRIDWVGADREQIIKQVDEVLNRYSDTFNDDVEILGSLGYAQIKGILNEGGKIRSNLEELQKYTDVFSPVGNFKREISGSYQTVHKNRVMERVAQRYANATFSQFQRVVSKSVRVIKENEQNYNVIWYGDLL